MSVLTTDIQNKKELIANMLGTAFLAVEPTAPCHFTTGEVCNLDDLNAKIATEKGLFGDLIVQLVNEEAPYVQETIPVSFALNIAANNNVPTLTATNQVLAAFIRNNMADAGLQPVFTTADDVRVQVSGPNVTLTVMNGTAPETNVGTIVTKMVNFIQTSGIWVNSFVAEDRVSTQEANAAQMMLNAGIQRGIIVDLTAGNDPVALTVETPEISGYEVNVSFTGTVGASVRINWGDFTAETPVTINASGQGTATHTYAATDNPTDDYAIFFTAKKADMITAIESVTVTIPGEIIEPPPVIVAPTITLDPVGVTELNGTTGNAVSVTFEVAGSEPITYTMDWGDGESPVVDAIAPDTPKTLLNIFDVADEYTAVLTASTPSGALLGDDVETFSSSESYQIGDRVKNPTNVFQANAATGPGTFNGAHWDIVGSVSDPVMLEDTVSFTITIE